MSNYVIFLVVLHWFDFDSIAASDLVAAREAIFIKKHAFYSLRGTRYF